MILRNEEPDKAILTMEGYTYAEFLDLLCFTLDDMRVYRTEAERHIWEDVQALRMGLDMDSVTSVCRVVGLRADIEDEESECPIYFDWVVFEIIEVGAGLNIVAHNDRAPFFGKLMSRLAFGPGARLTTEERAARAGSKPASAASTVAAEEAQILTPGDLADLDPWSAIIAQANPDTFLIDGASPADLIPWFVSTWRDCVSRHVVPDERSGLENYSMLGFCEPLAFKQVLGDGSPTGVIEVHIPVKGAERTSETDEWRARVLGSLIVFILTPVGKRTEVRGQCWNRAARLPYDDFLAGLRRISLPPAPVERRQSHAYQDTMREPNAETSIGPARQNGAKAPTGKDARAARPKASPGRPRDPHMEWARAQYKSGRSAEEILPDWLARRKAAKLPRLADSLDSLKKGLELPPEDEQYEAEIA